MRLFISPILPSSLDPGITSVYFLILVTLICRMQIRFIFAMLYCYLSFRCFSLAFYFLVTLDSFIRCNTIHFNGNYRGKNELWSGGFIRDICVLRAVLSNIRACSEDAVVGFFAVNPLFDVDGSINLSVVVGCIATFRRFDLSVSSNSCLACLHCSLAS